MAEKPDVSARAQAWIEALGSGALSAAPAAPKDAVQQIEVWRQRIDEIDSQLMRLLNSRSACAVEIGRIKRQGGLPVYSPEREARILERVVRESPGPLEPTAVRRVFERIIDESRRLERVGGQEQDPGVAETPSTTKA
jgi:chorismate mutase